MSRDSRILESMDDRGAQGAGRRVPWEWVAGIVGVAVLAFGAWGAVQFLSNYTPEPTAEQGSAALDPDQLAILKLKSHLQQSPEDRTARWELAQRYLEFDMGASALKELETLRESGPWTADYKTALSRAYLLLGSPEDVIKQYEDRDHALTREQRLVLAEALFAKAPSSAERIYRGLLSDVSARGAAHVGLALVELSRRQHVKAKAALEVAASQGNLDAKTRVRMGDAFMVLGDIDAAVDAYRSALTKRPHGLEARAGLARALLARNDVDGAAEAFTPLSERMGDHYLVHELKAHIALAREDFDAASAAARELQSLAPSSERALHLSAWIAYRQGRFVEARDALERMLKGKRDAPVGIGTLLASSHLALGDAGEAIKLLSQLRRSDPFNARVLKLLGEAYLKTGDTLRGAAALRRAAEVSPAEQADQLRLQVALSHLQGGNADKALKALERASNDSSQANLLRAIVNLRAGHEKDAMALAAAAGRGAQGRQYAAARDVEGQAMFARGDVAGARKAFDEALAAAPNYFAARINLARLEQYLGHLRDAKEHYESVLNAYPNHPDALMGLAQIERSNGNGRAALKLLASVAGDEESVAARLYTYRYHLAEKRLAQALEAAEGALEVAPRNLDALVAVGQARLANADPEGALSALRQARALAPHEPRIVLGLANYWRGQNKRSKAISEVDKFLARFPKSVSALVYRGQLAMEAGDVAGASAFNKRARAIDPRAASAAMLEVSLASQSTPGSHKGAASRAADSDTTGKSAIQLGISRARAGDWNAAEQLFRQRLAVNATDIRTRRLLAQVLQASGKLDAAAVEYEAIIGALGADARVLNNLALIRLGQGRKGEAETLAKRAFDASPAQPSMMNTYGWVLASSGKLKEGADLLEQAVATHPENPVFQYHLGAVMHQLGDANRAREALERALETGRRFEGRAEAEQLLEQLN